MSDSCHRSSLPNECQPNRESSRTYSFRRWSLEKIYGYIFAAQSREAGDSFLRSDASLEPSPTGEALIVNDLGKSWGDMELIDRIRWTSEGLERENFIRWNGMHLVVVRQRYVPLLTTR